MFFIIRCKDTNKRARNKKLASLFFTASASVFEVYLKDTKNLRKNGRMSAKYDKWLVLIPFLCYPAIFLISAEIAVYGGY